MDRVTAASHPPYPALQLGKPGARGYAVGEAVPRDMGEARGDIRTRTRTAAQSSSED